MSNRFHSKYHRSNHHTLSSANNLDSSHDPIASPDYPFKGSMVIDSSTDDLSLSALGNVTVQGNVSATAFYGDGTNLTGVVATPASENLSADNIYSYTNFVSSIKFHNNLDMNGWSISGIADESISFESGVKISSSSDNLFKVQADRVNLGDISNNIVGGDNSSIAGGSGNALTGRFVHIGGGSSNEVEGNSGASNYGTIGGGQSNKIDLNALNGFVGGGFSNSLSANYTSIAGGSTNKIHSGNHSFIGAGLRSTIISGPQSVIAGGLDNTINSSLGWSSIAGGKDNTVEGDYGTVIGGLNNKANAHISIAGGANTNVYGSNSIGLGYTNNIYSGASYAALLGGQNNIIDDGTHSFVGAGNTNALSGDCGVIGAGCYNTVSADNCAIVGGLSNYITGGSTNFIGAGTRNKIIDGAAGSVIGAGQDNAIAAGGASSSILGGLSNTLSGNAAFIGGGNQNTIHSLAAYNYNSIVGGDRNTIDYKDSGSTVTKSSILGGEQNNISASYSTVLGGQINNARGYNSIVGGTGAITDGLFAISLGYQTSAHHDNSVVIGGTTAGATVSENTNTIKLSGTNGITLGNGVTCDGDLDMQGFSIKRIGNNSLEFESGLTIGSDSSTSEFQVTSASNYKLGESNVVTGNLSFVGGNNNTVDGDDSTGFGISNTIYAAASSATVFGSGNQIDDGADSSILGGTHNSLSGDCLTICAGCFNTLSSQNSFIGGGTYNSITHGTVNMIGAGNRNIIDNCTGVTIVNGQDNTIGPMEDGQVVYSAIVAGGNNSLSGSASFIGAGYGNTIQKSSNGYNYSSIVGGYYNTIGPESTTSSIGGGRENTVNGDYSIIVGGISNRVDGNYSIAGGTACFVDGDFSVALGVAVSAHHDSSVVIGGYGGGNDPIVSDDARTVKLSGLNGVTLGENLTVVGNASATKFVGDGSDLTGVTAAATPTSNLSADTLFTLNNTNGIIDLEAGLRALSDNISAVEFHGDGSNLTGVTAAATPTSNLSADTLFTLNNTNGIIDLEAGLRALSDNISAVEFHGDGSNLTGIAASDSDAIHDNVAGEINAISEKTTPVPEDLLVIEDSADSYNKKKLKVGELFNQDYGMITVNLDNGTSTITTGVSAWAEMPFNGVIERVTILADQVGALSGEIQKDSYGNWPPNAADSILSFGGTNINKYEDNSPPGGVSLNLSAGDVMQFVVLSADTITKAVVSLKVRKEL